MVGAIDAARVRSVTTQKVPPEPDNDLKQCSGRLISFACGYAIPKIHDEIRASECTYAERALTEPANDICAEMLRCEVLAAIGDALDVREPD